MMKKSSGSSQKLGSFLSPGAPNYRERSVVSQKGWSSERVSRLTSSSRRQVPFNSGRTIPSKWDDAERWICSPVSSGYVNNKSCNVQQHQPRPKSKSGPIVPPGTAYYSNYSPTIPVHQQGLVVKNLMMGSPFTTGVLVPDALSLHRYYAHDTVFGPRYDMDNGIIYSSPVLNKNGVAIPSVSSEPVWSELPCDPSSSSNSQGEKHAGTTNEDPMISPFLKRDKGTQMSPSETEIDARSSPKSSLTSAMDQNNCHSAKLEVRDVQVDSQATLIKQSLLLGKDLKKSSMDAQASGSDIAESTLDISKFLGAEAKIIAWESLQKAKAEAELRKLEMKLEKKRSSSMDKILNKLRTAQMKAEKMRSSLIPVQQGQQVSKTWKVFSFPNYVQIWSSSSCFGTHAP